MSDHFGIRCLFQFRCSFAWARSAQVVSPPKPWPYWPYGLLLGLLPLAYLLRRRALLGLGALSSLGLLALRPKASPQGALERTVSVTAELASSAFRKRLKAQSERPAKTIASSPYDSFNGSVESYRLRPCIGWRPQNADGTLGPYTWRLGPCEQLSEGLRVRLSYGDAQFEVLRISSGLHRKFGLARNSQVGLPSLFKRD